jgi:hypothetical protein
MSLRGCGPSEQAPVKCTNGIMGDLETISRRLTEAEDAIKVLWGKLEFIITPGPIEPRNECTEKAAPASPAKTVLDSVNYRLMELVSSINDLTYSINYLA